MKEEARKRVKKLRKLIDHHRYLYHVLDKQEISEEALDSLKKELFDIERKHPDLITSYSPTQRVGGKPLDKFEKIKRKTPMLSLNDAFSKEDMVDWVKRIERLAGRDKIGFFCELKIDGLAFELIYKKGVLKSGSTRGDGLIGEDVTANIKTINSIPLKIRKDLNKGTVNTIFNKELTVRGEAFIGKKDFKKINREREKKKLPLYANPRNVVAGSIRQLDPKIAAERRIDSFVYDLATDLGADTHQEKHQLLRILGFKVNPHQKYCRNIEEVFNFYQDVLVEREKLPYEIDGVVVTVNDNFLFNKLGFVGKSPRGSIAYKFPLKETTTVVEDIIFQIGRTGTLTPVAILKPVNLSGVTIARATLHNEDEIKRLGIKIKDTVIVGRAGDVIPDIIRVLPELRTGKEKNFVFPKKCPFCKTEIKKTKKTSTIFYCSNKECSARKREYYSHFVSRKGFNFEGLGEKIVSKLIENKLISSPADLFFLKKEDILPLEGFQDKSAENVIKSIKNKKRIGLSRFLYSLGIENVGEETANLLEKRFGDLNSVKDASLEELISVKDIGEVTAENIYQWFRDEKNVEFLEKLKKGGVEIIYQKKPKDERFLDKTFILTGVLNSMSREKAAQKIKSFEGKVSQVVSSKTDFIVVGKNPGSKLEKAEKLKIKKLKEKDFLEMMK